MHQLSGWSKQSRASVFRIHPRGILRAGGEDCWSDISRAGDPEISAILDPSLHHTPGDAAPFQTSTDRVHF